MFGARGAGLVVALLVLATTATVFLVASRLHTGGPARPGKPKRRERKGPIHVCFCSDDTDLRSLLISIQTTLDHCKSPGRLRFHVVTSPELAPLFDTLLHLHVKGKGVNIKVHHEQGLQSQIGELVRFRSAFSERVSLASPFNFAPYYLGDFLGENFNSKRLIYLDTDVVVRGDLADIYNVDLKGHPVAAVKDCSIRFEDIFDMQVLTKLGYPGYDPRACIAQRGVFILDIPQWRELGLTAKIQEWMVLYRDAEDAIWRSGIAQPPWLLALNGNFRELHNKWNCHNLGREYMTLEEAQHVRRIGGFDHKAYNDLNIAINSKSGTMKPFLSMCSAKAKVLHFSGGLKPWLKDVWRNEKQPAPLCAISDDTASTGHKYNTTLSCRSQNFVQCQEIWAEYISRDADCALKDLEKEWMEEEEDWQADMKRDLKKRAKEEEEKQRLKQEEAALEKEKKQKDEEAKEKEQLEKLEKEAKDQGDGDDDEEKKDQGDDT